MYIYLLVLIVFLSVIPFGEKISVFIVKNRLLISKFLLIVGFGTFLLLFSEVSVRKSGELSLELLWFVMWLPILSKVFSFQIATKLMLFRRELGIWMGIMAFVHSALYLLKPHSIMFWNMEFWYSQGLINYLGVGLISSIITMVLLFTSNDYSLKALKKYWKLIQKFAYAVLIFTLIHVALIEIYKYKGEGPIFESVMITFLPFFIYFIGKILEWFRVKIKIDLMKVIIIGLIGFIISISFMIIDYKPENKLVVNVTSQVKKCDDLCRNDSETYCNEINEVIFSQTEITYGTCRTLSKYNTMFHRCTGFCTQYGKEKKINSGCKFSDGSNDYNCDGKR